MPFETIAAAWGYVRDPEASTRANPVLRAPGLPKLVIRRRIMRLGALSGPEATFPHVAKGATVKCEKQSRQTQVTPKYRTDSPCLQNLVPLLLDLVDVAQDEHRLDDLAEGLHHGVEPVLPGV